MSAFLCISIEHLADRRSKLKQTGLVDKVLIRTSQTDLRATATPTLSVPVGPDIEQTRQKEMLSAKNLIILRNDEDGKKSPTMVDKETKTHGMPAWYVIKAGCTSEVTY